ncbi:MAG: hypothetical protein CMM08_18565 [Rhodospirillaceae bacterium]|jgi:hypothetical protein|nr:hypothetical protein [Rhodospirillaceae bacterium]|tara:strand:- start:1873 stop:2133 length:261 start_codon:yes stop_codon:yes gene_type:complete
MHIIIDPEDSPNIDANMGDIVRHIARDIDTAFEKCLDRDPSLRGDLALLASSVVHYFADKYGDDGIQALLRTRTISREVEKFSRDD